MTREKGNGVLVLHPTTKISRINKGKLKMKRVTGGAQKIRNGSCIIIKKGGGVVG